MLSEDTDVKRRRFLQAGAALLTCPICTGLAGRAAWAAGDKPHWSYHGATGPDAWGTLDPAYGACGAGTQQSPIDLAGAVKADLPPIAVQWKPVKLDAVVNNGHTIQVNTATGGHMVLDGARYDLLQFHFHHMSEHTLDGRQFPLEVHFVHKATGGNGLAVIGVFFAEGAENATLAPIWQAMPEREGEASSSATVDPATLLPASRTAFRYAGSLTTPPCSEIVNWTVFGEPLSASSGQIAAFAKMFPNNFRPVQPRNRRFLLSSG